MLGIAHPVSRITYGSKCTYPMMKMSTYERMNFILDKFLLIKKLWGWKLRPENRSSIKV